MASKRPPGVPCEFSGRGGDRDDDDDDDDDYDLDEACESGVQLGMAVPLEGQAAEQLLFTNTDWHDWDGGKAGGWPVWLNPRDLPSPEKMRCGDCKHPLSFLVQLYCPLDHEDDAFHRCLYVFCCPQASCSTNSSVKAFRCQLPRSNDFYPYKPEDKEIPKDASNAQGTPSTERRAGADPAAWGVKLCCVCGQLAKSACSKCKQARYCGREHQAEHWKMGGHKESCNRREATDKGSAVDGTSKAPRTHAMASVFRELEVEIRPEPPPPPVAPDGRTAEDDLASKLDLGKADISDGVDEDAKLSQAELDKIAGVHGVKDKVTLTFLTRTQANPQVVRYDAVGAGPLWSSSKGMPGEADVPPCSRCGRARKFEFQVMPHLLYFLGVEANATVLNPQTAGPGPCPRPFAPSTGKCMDWGTLAVYTCPASCSTGAGRGTDAGSEEDGAIASGKDGGGTIVEAYVEEFVWRQPPP